MLWHNLAMPGERWYITGLIAGLLVLSLAILGFRWGTLAARIPLSPQGAEVSMQSQPASAAGDKSGAASKAAQAHSKAGEHTRERASGSAGRAAERRSGTQTKRLNINRATATQLEELPGIGPVLAARIIDYRQAHGAFRDAGDLLNVSGIGPGKLGEIEELVYAGPAD